MNPTRTMNTKKEIGYMLASGRIEFSTSPLEEHPGLPICPEYAEHPRYREEIETWARLAYDNKTLLVPGIPEAKTLNEKLDALTRFCRLVEDYMLIQTAAKNAGI